jgi:hypothetical protein
VSVSPRTRSFSCQRIYSATDQSETLISSTSTKFVLPLLRSIRFRGLRPKIGREREKSAASVSNHRATLATRPAGLSLPPSIARASCLARRARTRARVDRVAPRRGRAGGRAGESAASEPKEGRRERRSVRSFVPSRVARGRGDRALARGAPTLPVAMPEDDAAAALVADSVENSVAFKVRAKPSLVPPPRAPSRASIDPSDAPPRVHPFPSRGASH